MAVNIDEAWRQKVPIQLDLGYVWIVGDGFIPWQDGPDSLILDHETVPRQHSVFRDDRGKPGRGKNLLNTAVQSTVASATPIWMKGRIIPVLAQPFFRPCPESVRQ